MKGVQSLGPYHVVFLEALTIAVVLIGLVYVDVLVHDVGFAYVLLMYLMQSTDCECAIPKRIAAINTE